MLLAIPLLAVVQIPVGIHAASNAEATRFKPSEAVSVSENVRPSEQVAHPAISHIRLRARLQCRASLMRFESRASSRCRPARLWPPFMRRFLLLPATDKPITLAAQQLR